MTVAPTPADQCQCGRRTRDLYHEIPADDGLRCLDPPLCADCYEVEYRRFVRDNGERLAVQHASEPYPELLPPIRPRPKLDPGDPRCWEGWDEDDVEYVKGRRAA